MSAPETDIVERARARIIETCKCDICQIVVALCGEIEDLRKHVKDLNHDFDATVKHCNEHHVEGDYDS